jgi:hypothetical protein
MKRYRRRAGSLGSCQRQGLDGRPGYPPPALVPQDHVPRALPQLLGRSGEYLFGARLRGQLERHGLRQQGGLSVQRLKHELRNGSNRLLERVPNEHGDPL